MNLRLIAFGLVALVCFFVLSFGAANAVDYFKFHGAIARVERLTQSQVLTIANYARNVNELDRFDAKQIPLVFQPLKPLRVSVNKGNCQVLLYEFGDVYLWAWVETSASNQSIIYFTNSTGPQRRTVVWNQNGEFVRRNSPTGRLVTVTQSSMGNPQDWIVLQDEICVVHRNSYVGGEDVVQAISPLDAQGQRQILEGLGSLGPAVRGKYYRAAGIADGIELSICFTPTGEAGKDDIVLSNAWVDGVKPLVDAISRFGPKKFPIEFEESVSRSAFLRGRPVNVRTLPEMEALLWPKPKTPWWCVWRTFLR